MSASTTAVAITDAHRAMVRKETLIGVVLNIVVATIIVGLLYWGEEPIPVLGTSGGAFGIVGGTFMFTLGMTIGLTLTVRGRLRKGLLPRLPLSALPAFSQRLPQPLFVRGLALAVGAWILAVPVTWFLLGALAPTHWSFFATLAFNIVYFVTMCLIIVPYVVWRALSDPV
jgi:hypothetical protein